MKLLLLKILLGIMLIYEFVILGFIAMGLL